MKKGLLSRIKTRHAYQAFAKKYELVYFGHVNQHSDDHEQVRGLTVSTHHRDDYYSVGTIQDFDVTILERADTLRLPDRDEHSYRWAILEIKPGAHKLPHIFIDGHGYDETFYATLFLKHRELVNQNALLPLSEFARIFRVFAARDHYSSQNFMTIINMTLMSMLETHFKGLDFEIKDSSLYVYSQASDTTSLHKLEHMLRIGLWLAEMLHSLPLEA